MRVLEDNAKALLILVILFCLFVFILYVV